MEEPMNERLLVVGVAAAHAVVVDVEYSRRTGDFGRSALRKHGGADGEQNHE
jgi:hypothetical protein